MSGSPSKQPIEPKRLELSVNQEDGSLLTAPLSTVLLAATDGLYTDLYNAAHGEFDVTTAAQQGEGDDDDAPAAVATVTTTKKERMSNLSFAQRRHELAWRLVQHGKGLTHVAALTAANASTDFSTATRVSTKALQHARTAWVQADEAQDALYFFHAQLFPARQSPHDVYGALDVQLIGQWLDMPTDLRLTTDRFNTSREARWSSKEVTERWQMAVRNKLLTGEVAWMRRRRQQQPTTTNEPLWNVSLKGGIVRLTHGTPKAIGGGGGPDQAPPVYPIVALLTVLSTSTPSQWSLLSVEVRATPKTGESNHQLEASNRQRYNLHRLSALAMAKEEAQIRKLNKADEEEAEAEASNSDTASADAIMMHGDVKAAVTTTNAATILTTEVQRMARPLNRLFEVVHTFALSWQLEILSAQAQTLKRGNWAAGGKQPIVVTPVSFTEPNSSSNTNNNNNINNNSSSGGTNSKNNASGGNASNSTGNNNSNNQNNSNNTVIGVVSMSFWRVDDQYGPPYMGDLYLKDNTQSSQSQNNSESYDETRNEITPPVTNQLTLSIRAETNVGIRVSLSGGMPKSQIEQPHIQATLQELLDAAANPFALSASGALLAATRLCAEQKCHAIVRALQPSVSDSTAQVLPSWMHLKVERTCIAVFARIIYHGVPLDDQAPMVELFRLTCDARTGSFMCTFARSTTLLRMLACNDIRASESTTLRIMALPPRRRRVAGVNSIAKIVRDALDGLTRSMNALGYRTGVGGIWKDRDGMSASLRQRAIQSACGDARVALIKSCGIVALYGLSALALGVATGVTVTHDMAGDPLGKVDGVPLLNAPPLSVLLDQQLMENESKTADGEKKKTSYIEQQLFAIGCAVSAENLTLYPMDISVHLDTPVAAPRRVNSVLVKLKAVVDEDESPNDVYPAKRQKISVDNGRTTAGPRMQELSAEVERFATLLSNEID